MSKGIDLDFYIKKNEDENSNKSESENNNQNYEINTILVTGASGYLGSYCVLECLFQGYNVKAQTRTKSIISLYDIFKNFPNKDKLEIVKCELTKEDETREILKDVDCVINCAAHYDEETNDEMSVIYPCIELLLNLLHKCKDLGIKRFIHISSAETIYGGKYRSLYNERHWANPDHLGINEKAKFFSEKAAKYFYEQNKDILDYTCFNPTLLIGKPIKGIEIGRSSKLISYLMDEKTKYIMNLKIPLINVVDTSKIIVDSIKNKKCYGERYILCQGNYWIDDINELLNKEYSKYNYKLNKNIMGKFKIWILSFFDSNINNILSFYGKDFVLCDDKIRENFKIIYKPIDETISEMIHYLIENNYIEEKGSILEDFNFENKNNNDDDYDNGGDNNDGDNNDGNNNDNNKNKNDDNNDDNNDDKIDDNKDDKKDDDNNEDKEEENKSKLKFEITT